MKTIIITLLVLCTVFFADAALYISGEGNSTGLFESVAGISYGKFDKAKMDAYAKAHPELVGHHGE